MDRLSDQFFTRSALPEDQYRHIGMDDTVEELEDRHHRRRARDDTIIGVTEIRASPFFQSARALVPVQPLGLTVTLVAPYSIPHLLPRCEMRMLLSTQLFKQTGILNKNGSLIREETDKP